ncbi:31247_t:CDS:2 [Racocetra persica]|uniref:31247_t:CDS:1 n=1 Tax=Racocetra persica TaxID=160502 RepID=A0ACA9K912_9GLOM|nr:31247_t:CDS:2 [Racocetra persica]
MIWDTITKNIKNLNKKYTQQRTNKPRTCYLYEQEGQIIKNCPNQIKSNDKPNASIRFNNANLRFVEFSKKNDENDRKYLKIELLDEEEASD